MNPWEAKNLTPEERAEAIDRADWQRTHSLKDIITEAIRAAVAKEREACAALVEKYARRQTSTVGGLTAAGVFGLDLAATIRGSSACAGGEG